ncbi:MAG: EamA family transporter [bacterium]|nr:EamA family transporter [bacterium]
MLWILIAIFSYFLLAVSALGDKYLLSGPPEPKSYTFFINVSGILLLALIPFVGFVRPDSRQILLSFLAGGSMVFASYFLYSALEKFEASRVIPAIGGLLPIFTLGIVFLFSGSQSLTPKSLAAFLLLVLGSVLISADKGKAISLESLFFSAASAFLFALSFVLVKSLYLELPFWTTIILTRLGAFLASLVFLLAKETRAEIFQKNFILQKKSGIIFFATQGIGTLASLLQNWAILLAPLGFLAFVNALEGTRYVFLLVLSVLVSAKFPKILKEEISPKSMFQKSLAVLIIIIGLGVLTLSLKT